LPTPGVITQWEEPSGPGVRVDAGFTKGDVIGGNFDSLLAKLIVTGATRKQALERARRALAEFKIEGIATALPFHRAVINDVAFINEPFAVYTGWIESEFNNQISPYGASSEENTTPVIEEIVVEVDGHRFEVGILSPIPKRKRALSARTSLQTGDSLTTPMQGTVVKIEVAEGQAVEEGELIVVLEAMKMEQPLKAHKSGIISNLTVSVGDTIATGTLLCKII
jgi:acetyl-CoA/propionyl-CoA carboxylase biotin carboxyl carrier protein